MKRNNLLDFSNSEKDLKTEIQKPASLVFQSFNWLASKPKYKLISEDGELLEESDEEFIMQCFGVTESGASVCLNIEGFNPFFYVELGKYWNKSWTKPFVQHLIDQTRDREGLAHYEVCDRILFNEFTNEQKRPFLCLVFNNIDSYGNFKKLFYRRIQVYNVNRGYAKQYCLCESNLPPTMRYLHVMNLDPIGWMKASNVRFTKESSCNITGTIDWKSLQPVEKEGYAPILQASFDIECTSGSGDFPQASKPSDKVVQICTTFRQFGAPKDEYVLKHRIVLGEYAEVSSTELVVCETEVEVLLAWTKLIQDMDPDLVIGYNITGFDMSYMVERAEYLDCYDEFMNMSRVSNRTTHLDSGGITTSAKGENKFKVLDMPGRIVMDLLKIIRWEYKLVSYKLDFVGQKFLNAGKDPVTPRDIFDAYQDQRGDEITEDLLEKRKRICDYCVQDCVLVQELCDNLCLLLNNMQMGSVCSTPMHDILYRGQGIKLFSLVVKYCKNQGYIMRENQRHPGNNRYEGAIVLDPQCGFYDHPIVVQDFNSLYPSCMRDCNYSPDCLVVDQKYNHLPDMQYKSCSYQDLDDDGELMVDDDDKPIMATHKWAQPEKGGILPQILTFLLNERNAAKKAMKNTDDPMLKMVYNGKQLSYKVAMNSIYGQTGAPTSSFYCKPVAACTTAEGRKLILFSKKYVEDNYPGAEVIYGDTDSIFVKPPIDKTDKTDEEILTEAFIWGDIAGKAITKAIGSTIHNLEYEKTFYPFAQTNKKRYFGRYYEWDPKKWKLVSMGDASKRRDYAPFVKNVYNGMKDILMERKDFNAAVSFTLNQVEQLFADNIGIDDFIISKSLKSFEGYKNPESIGHCMLAEKIRERDPGNAYQPGDRVPFVFIEHYWIKDPRPDNKIEDPVYMQEHSELKVDKLHYLHHIEQVLLPVLTMEIKDAHLLFDQYVQKEKARRVALRQSKGYGMDPKQKQMSSFFKKQTKKIEEHKVTFYSDDIEWKEDVEKLRIAKMDAEVKKINKRMRKIKPAQLKSTTQPKRPSSTLERMINSGLGF